MRAITAPHRATLGGRTVYYYIRQEVQNESGTWINLSSDPISGHDWIEDCVFTLSIDQPVSGGTLTLKREIAEDATPLLSLAPFIVGSPLNVDDLAAYSPIIHPGRGYRAWLAPVAAGTPEPAFPGAEWRKVFEGRLDRPQWGPGDTIAVQFRDLGANLADSIITEERKYGSAAGIAVETVMQQILNDSGFTSVTIMLPDGSPGWQVHEFTQARVPVMEAITALASQIGWAVRYRWGTGVDANTPQLHFYDPGRTAAFADLVNGVIIGPDEYIAVNEMSIGDEDVRNYGRLKFINALTGTPDEATAFDGASIGTFGLRYIEIGEAHTSNIDSLTEAQAMIDAVIADLSTPFADHGIDTFCLWALELHDQVQFDPNDIHYSDAQTYAIVQIRTQLRAGHATSTILTRGKPAGGYRSWILKHGIGPGDPSGVPAPIFSYLLGEFSHGGGVTGDGMVWIGGRFDKNTEFILVYGSEGDDDRTPTPDLSENSLCLRLGRPEGDIGSADDFEFLIGIATRPDRWRKIRAFGVGFNGLKGPDWIPPPVPATDPVPTPSDGVIQGFTINPVAVSATNVLNITPGAIDPAGNNFIIVRRDGVDIIQHFIDADPSAVFIDDPGINPNAKYTYETFIWNNGVSGKHRRHGVGLPATPDFDWDQQAPKLIYDSGSSRYLVALHWKITPGTFLTADHIVFEYGKNGVNFPTEIGQTSVLSTVFTDPNVRAKWYRMRLEDAANNILAYSTPGYFDGKGVPPSWGNTSPPIWNPTPSAVILRAPNLSIGVPSLVVGFICPTSGAVTCEIQGSDDSGVTDPWVVDFESGQLAGDKWTPGPGIPARYFRLVAKDANDVALAMSNVEFWPGFVTP